MKRLFAARWLALAVLAFPTVSFAARQTHPVDQIWTRANLSAIRLQSVAMLPAVSFDDIGPAERHAEGELMKIIRDAGFRWITAPTAREMLRHVANDSIVPALKPSVLKNARVDSASTPAICGLLRVNGLITVRVDRAEQVNVQSDQSGKPSTTVYVHATLVDSLGQLIWSASGENTLEGPYLQAAPTGSNVLSSQLGNTPNQAKNNAPDWPEALDPLFLRWRPSFPSRSAFVGGVPAAAADSSKH